MSADAKAAPTATIWRDLDRLLEAVPELAHAKTRGEFVDLVFDVEQCARGDAATDALWRLKHDLLEREMRLLAERIDAKGKAA